MSKIEFKRFNIDDYLMDSESIAEYLNDMHTNGSIEEFLVALNDVVRAKGVKNIAQEAGVNRESLYKSLDSSTKVRFETIVNILNVLGVEFSFKPTTAAVR
ncbi:MAG: putative addiction module antidote protein [Deferribacteraceae bacterium]|jgi:probable addiction module antidote protein|nr:putative addiction module antidote protein [Deferribacteraceae bacterium]